MEEKWDSACEWCKENWQSIVSVFVTIVIVVGIVILSISTFGTAIPVIAVGVVGAIVGVSGQLISDIISCAITGDWAGNWQSYIGSAIGGFAGGVLLLLTNPIAACSAEAAISYPPNNPPFPKTKDPRVRNSGIYFTVICRSSV